MLQDSRPYPSPRVSPTLGYRVGHLLQASEDWFHEAQEYRLVKKQRSHGEGVCGQLGSREAKLDITHIETTQCQCWSPTQHERCSRFGH